MCLSGCSIVIAPKWGETKKKEIRNRLFMPVLRSLATDYAACSKLAGKAMFGKRDSHTFRMSLTGGIIKVKGGMAYDHCDYGISGASII